MDNYYRKYHTARYRPYHALKELTRVQQTASAPLDPIVSIYRHLSQPIRSASSLRTASQSAPSTARIFRFRPPPTPIQTARPAPYPPPSSRQTAIPQMDLLSNRPLPLVNPLLSNLRPAPTEHPGQMQHVTL